MPSPTPIDSTWADGYALSHLVAHVLRSHNLPEPSGIIEKLLEAQRSEDPAVGISQLSLALEIARGKLGLVVEGSAEQIVKELLQEKREDHSDEIGEAEREGRGGEEGRGSAEEAENEGRSREGRSAEAEGKDRGRGEEGEGEEEHRVKKEQFKGEEGRGASRGPREKQNSPSSPLAKLVFQLQVASEAAAHVAAATAPSTAGGEGAGTARDDAAKEEAASHEASKETSNPNDLEEATKEGSSASRSGEAIQTGASASGNSPYLAPRRLSYGVALDGGEDAASVRLRQNSVGSSVSALTVDSSEGSLGLGKKGSSAQKRLPKSKLQVIVQKQNDLKETLTVLAHTNPGKEKDQELIKKWNEVVAEKDRLLREQMEKTKKETERNSDHDGRGSCSVM